jgi:inner membrane protein
VESFVKFTAHIKIAALIGVVGVLLFGLSLIQGIVQERYQQRDAAISSIGSAQTLIGPIIHSACVETWDRKVKTDDGITVKEQRREFMLTALPDNLDIVAGANVSQRSRSLHAVNVFAFKPTIKAKWANLDVLTPTRSVQDSRLNCGAPIAMLSVSDSSGIRSVELKINGAAQTLKAGTFHPRYARGVHAMLPDSLRTGGQELNAEFNLELMGTQNLSIVPLGGTTQVKVSSNWPHPSFGGNFLPSERTVQADGFSALWRISSLATNVGAALHSSSQTAEDAQSSGNGQLESLDISFIEPVNFYSLSDRATKYGILFIVLTFVAVGMFELMKRLRVHPVQYFLVGSAISSFFLLLVSLSEHIGFDMAYASAATACVLLLMYYASYMLGGMVRGLPFGAGIALLYGLLYMLLQLEQTSLMVGAIALFVVLALVMGLTRKVNWYQLGNTAPAEPVAPAATRQEV